MVIVTVDQQPELHIPNGLTKLSHSATFTSKFAAFFCFGRLRNGVVTDVYGAFGVLFTKIIMRGLVHCVGRNKQTKS